MEISGFQFWSNKMHIGLAVIFSLFLICFAAIVVEELFLGGRRRRRAERDARQRPHLPE